MAPLDSASIVGPSLSSAPAAGSHSSSTVEAAGAALMRGLRLGDDEHDELGGGAHGLAAPKAARRVSGGIAPLDPALLTSLSPGHYSSALSSERSSTDGGPARSTHSRASAPARTSTHSSGAGLHGGRSPPQPAAVARYTNPAFGHTLPPSSSARASGNGSGSGAAQLGIGFGALSPQLQPRAACTRGSRSSSGGLEPHPADACTPTGATSAATAGGAGVATAGGASAATAGRNRGVSEFSLGGEGERDRRASSEGEPVTPLGVTTTEAVDCTMAASTDDMA